jgi:excisionase family DNA binding protein
MGNSAAPAIDSHAAVPGTVADQPERLLTISDVATWLGVSKAWVYDHATRKKPLLPCIRFGELTRFRRSEIELFIQEHVRTDGSAG